MIAKLLLRIFSRDVRELMAQCEGWEKAARRAKAQGDDCLAVAEEWKARAVAVEADARRYRFLRFNRKADAREGAELDAAIDRELAGSGSAGE